jgi:hypothetical protein
MGPTLQICKIFGAEGAGAERPGVDALHSQFEEALEAVHHGQVGTERVLELGRWNDYGGSSPPPSFMHLEERGTEGCVQGGRGWDLFKRM